MKPEFVVIRWAVFSRIIVFLFANLTHLKDFDSSSFVLLNMNSKKYGFFDEVIKRFFGVFLKWDAIYFFGISRDGYLYEQQHAFFPLYPLITRGFSLIIKSFILKWNYLSEESILLVSGVTLSNLSFVLASLSLYKLTFILFKQERFSILATIFFCINPASIFMSSLYSESFFSFLSFSGMYFFFAENYFMSSVMWGISSFTRSNGILYSGFYIYRVLKTIFIQKKESFSITILDILKSVLYILISLSGFLVFQYYGYSIFCLVPQPRKWCGNQIPILYSFVQEYYWNNGFMKYYTINQLPNFLMAFPMIMLSLFGIYKYIRTDFKRFITLDLLDNNYKLGKPHTFYSNIRILPFIILWIFMLLYCVFMMHVQVITRFFCCSLPCVFWYSAQLFEDNYVHPGNDNGEKNICAALLKYFLIYNLIGIVLFNNFYPPA